MEESANCQVCGENTPHTELKHAAILQGGVERFAAERLPEWRREQPLCRRCLNRLRADFVRAQMQTERDELRQLETEAREAMRAREEAASSFTKDYDAHLSVGERVADRIAEFGGSWWFIFGFFGVVVAWIAVNSASLFARPFDPFPFILLNLGLSLLAAIQAPVIMMSQNRQEERDRRQAENDYEINRKAEIEVQALNNKMDQLLHNQWTRLLEIQHIQMEMLDDLADRERRLKR